MKDALKWFGISIAAAIIGFIVTAAVGSRRSASSWWISVVVVLIQMVHGKVAATLSMVGLSGIWPGATVMALAAILSATAAIIAYHNSQLGRRVWTTKVQWTTIPAAVLVAFIVVSLFL